VRGLFDDICLWLVDRTSCCLRKLDIRKLAAFAWHIGRRVDFKHGPRFEKTWRWIGFTKTIGGSLEGPPDLFNRWARSRCRLAADMTMKNDQINFQFHLGAPVGAVPDVSHAADAAGV
jgi:hypothetical protein